MCEKIPVPAIIACVVIIFATAQILNMPNISVYRFGIYGAGFFLGYFIFSHDVVMERIEKWCYILSSIAIISGIAFVILYWGKPYA